MSYPKNNQGDTMMKALLLLSAVAATSVAPTLNAQAVTSKPDSTCTNYPDGRVECKIMRGSARGDSAFGNRLFFRMDSAMARRAALGLQLRPTGTRRDTLGVFVDAVTPKGPAETAGIIEGDRIAAINGIDLRTAAADTDDPYTNGLAAHRLTREVQKLTPGSRVTLRVYSSGRFRDVAVTAAKASDVMRLGGRFNLRVPGPGGMMQFHGPGGGPMMFGPEMPMMHRRLNLPRGTQLRSPMRIRVPAPARAPAVLKIEADGNDGYEDVLMLDGDYEDALMLDMYGDPLDFVDELEPVPPEMIRD
jgi:PDZ domain-containing protein